MEPMINAEKLLEKLEQQRGYIRKAQEECVDRYEFDFLRARIAESLHVTEVVEKMAATPADPVGHGHWIGAVFVALDVAREDYQMAIQDYCNHGGDAQEWQPDTQYCSECLAGFNVFDNDFILNADYCPRCGARMDEVSE